MQHESHLDAQSSAALSNDGASLPPGEMAWEKTSCAPATIMQQPVPQSGHGWSVLGLLWAVSVQLNSTADTTVA